jgi:hypothetical protein
LLDWRENEKRENKTRKPISPNTCIDFHVLFSLLPSTPYKTNFLPSDTSSAIIQIQFLRGIIFNWIFYFYLLTPALDYQTLFFGNRRANILKNQIFSK